jgi:hypothetical protein
MNPIIRNVLAVIAGLVVGSILNMVIINMSSSIIPPPEGADVTTMDGLKASMHLFQPRHFIFPFLAHALGTLAGAILASLIAVTHKMKFALTISLFFMIGGIINIFMLPSPLWFSILDLAGAYIPMGWIGGKIVSGKK